MNPLFILTAVFAAASAAPTHHVAPLAAHPLGYGLGLGYGAPIAAAAPIAVAAPAIALPADRYTKHVAGAPTVSVHQPPAQIRKEVHLGTRTYVAGYDTTVMKPVIPDLNIAVPTALKGTTTYNAPIVKTQTEIHTVNQPIPVEKPYAAPYDVPVPVEKVVEVPVEVRVNKPYAVHRPVAVQGEPIVQVHETAPIVRERHHHVQHPAIHAGYAHTGYGLGLGLPATLPAGQVIAH